MSKKTKDEESIIFKIITLGESGVGKTSILRRFLYKLFDSNSISTIGLSFAFKDIILKNKEKVQLKLIDTGGQEKYRALAKSYFKNAEGVFFVYSIDNEESFENIKEWINLFNENRSVKEGIPLFLVETKNDLERVVDEEKSQQFAKENNLQWISTSSKDNINIEKLFEDMAESMYNEYRKKNNLTQKNIHIKNEKKKKKLNVVYLLPRQIED